MRGYKSEEYRVVTEDGYILHLSRIVTGEKLGPYLPVYLQHGYIAASDQWLLRGRNKDLAFILADNGFDVWLGDQRGNTYSRSHVKYTTKEKKFWDFGLQDLGYYDVPAFLKKIIEVTNAPQVTYFGHSLGTSEFLVFASERPELATKLVRLAVLLAPVAYAPQPSQSTLLKYFISIGDVIVNNLERMRKYEFLPREPAVQSLIQGLCSQRIALNTCYSIYSNFYGENKRNIDLKLFPFYFSSLPSGTSLKNTKHLLQLFKTGNFSKFDYGPTENIKIYGQATPPPYKIENIQVPVALVYGANDGFLNRETVDRLAKMLPNVKKYEVFDPNFSHMDFMFGFDSKKMVSEKIIEPLKLMTIMN